MSKNTELISTFENIKKFLYNRLGLLPGVHYKSEELLKLLTIKGGLEELIKYCKKVLESGIINLPFLYVKQTDKGFIIGPSLETLKKYEKGVSVPVGEEITEGVVDDSYEKKITEIKNNLGKVYN